MPDLTEERLEVVHCAMMNLLWPRHGIAVQEFYDYWVGAHTQISSRLPGIHQYFQHQLDPEGGRLLPPIANVDQSWQSGEIFYGDAEITFATPAHLSTFAGALHPLMEDEQNVFAKTISYQAIGPNSFTVLDETRDDCPNGSFAPEQKFMLYIRKRHEVPLAQFRAHMAALVAPALASGPGVLKVRVRLPEPYDNDKVTLLAPNVSNREDPNRQYQACVELAFSSPLGRQEFGLSDAWLQASAGLAEAARTVHVLQVLRTYTVYNHGRITTAGLRTPLIAEQIARLGAVNQVGDEVRTLILREHTAAH